MVDDLEDAAPQKGRVRNSDQSNQKGALYSLSLLERQRFGFALVREFQSLFKSIHDTERSEFNLTKYLVTPVVERLQFLLMAGN